MKFDARRLLYKNARSACSITGHIGLGWSGRATGLAAHGIIVRSHVGHIVIGLALATRVVAATLQFRVMF